jgi:hypothetical protein
MDQDRAKKIVGLAASQAKNPVIKDWLSRDERGTWVTVARSILIAKKKDHKKLSDDEIDAEVVDELISRITTVLR